MNNKIALKKIMTNLRNGKAYGKYKTAIIADIEETYFSDVLVLTYNTRNGRPLIRWDYYGSSCNGNNLKDLNWIIRVIFKTTPLEFINTYECIQWD